MKIVSNVTYQGESVFKFDQYLPTATGSDGTQFDGIEIDSYSRKNGGDYYVIVGDLNASYLDGAFELSQTGYSLLILTLAPETTGSPASKMQRQCNHCSRKNY